ncbi:MAG: hypothetical protein ACXAC2_03640 [Candidatus Kariarchaeaceae archaeon]
MKHFVIIISIAITLIIGIIPVNGELDLQEANVTKVVFENLSSDNYRFHVTLYHDDDGEDGYADFWQVEAIDGTVLGTRILTHAHSTAEFTRSADITVPKEVIIVIVRGHDQIHGFGGQIIAVHMETNSQQIIDQGTDLLDFSDFQFNFSNSVEQTTIVVTEDTTKSTVEESSNDDSPFLLFPLLIGLLTILVHKRRK